MEWDDLVNSGADPAGSSVHFLRVPAFWDLRCLQAFFVGPPGTGKTLIASLIASQTKRSFYPLTAASVLSGGVGDSVKLRGRSIRTSKQQSPSLVFIDEMDGLLPANNRYLGQRDVQVVEQFLTEISSFHPDNRVFLVGTTNHAEDIDTRVLRGGRFCEKLTIPLPNAEHRVQLLNPFLQGTRMQHELTISDVASQLDGASPADLQAICIAAKRIAFTVRPITTNSRPFLWSNFETATVRVRGS